MNTGPAARAGTAQPGPVAGQRRQSLGRPVRQSLGRPVRRSLGRPVGTVRVFMLVSRGVLDCL
ncbi:hypothetical protein B0I31_12439 [Saccharothrix carnea]|uniref:Uncharacterized protein n=1 Tax=Saccharothrix carnea TaxID=1280637 RepID=A0A2P8HR45_SACCR|nr:hypothetical protein B0I31_12439 [Saccharothrix carnea]